MARRNLSTRLAAWNVAAVLIATAIVGTAAVALLRHQAEDQALARVRQASAIAGRAIVAHGDRLVSSALLLAERPTLSELLRAGDPEELNAFLERFCQREAMNGCALFLDGRKLAECGWPDAWGADMPGSPVGAWFLQGGSANGAGSARANAGAGVSENANGRAPLLLGASAPVLGVPGARVRVAVEIDAAYLRAAGEQTGMRISVLPRAIVERGVARPGGRLGMRVLESAHEESAKVPALDAYLGVAPLTEPMGRVAGVVEARLPAAMAAPSLTRIGGTLFALALGAAILAALAGIGLGRRIARPVEQLTAAATRIGGGDLVSPVQADEASEIEPLVEALEGMRERLLAHTAKLTRRQAEAEAVLAGIVEGVFGVGRARRIRYINPQAAKLLGIQPEEAIGKFCGDVLCPQGPGGVRPCEESCPILHARFRGSARATEELLLPNGRRRTVIVTSSPSGSSKEDGALQFQVIRDETELETSRRLRDAVLANISHEFRTPLSAQLASLELLLDRLDDLPPADRRELICSVQRGTLRLTRLVDNLLESTRIEAGEESLRRQTVALDEVMEEAVELIAPLIEQRDQKLQVHLPYPLPPVTGDGPRLTQVFVNLLANANKFAPSGSTITVQGSVSEREIEIWVGDEGPGLPPGMGEEIFQRFVRSGEEEPEASGMGLGLFIVRSIVERHGGRVTAESHANGTRMHVILPREGVSPEAEARGERAGAAEGEEAGAETRGGVAEGPSSEGATRA